MYYEFDSSLIDTYVKGSGPNFKAVVFYNAGEKVKKSGVKVTDIAVEKKRTASRKRCFHPKVFIIEFGDVLRVVVGSANLTHASEEMEDHRMCSFRLTFLFFPFLYQLRLTTTPILSSRRN